MFKQKSSYPVILIAILLTSIVLFYAFSQKSNYDLQKLAPIGSVSDIKGKWINTDKDISLENLNGKVVLIEFWTFGCYNCKNTLPYVKDWYSKYRSDKFEVIGIHCPEFDNERKFDNVKKAVDELEIQYPVLIDNEFSIWNKFDVHAWPTIVILDKSGTVRYTHVGEGSYDKTEKKIAELMNE
ncbi:hypothetical protein BH10BAC5_BH10BAC5_03030 [soil metagenome]